MKKLFIIISCFCLSCHTKSKKEAQITQPDKNNKKASLNKTIQVSNVNENLGSRIRGTWTDGSTQNASFDIQADSILYVDNLKSYKYTFHENIIKIYYEDYIYQGRISFKSDTMLMVSREGDTSKVWRFTD